MTTPPKPRTCVSCLQVKLTPRFRGARYKAQACIECEDARPGERWCVDCEAWLPDDNFYRVGRDQKFQTIRCKPCVVLSGHGVNRAHMARLTGSVVPACCACGDTKRLSVDHDHAHCPGEHGCPECVRGYLCQPCNTAEGLLKTFERAVALANYMARTTRAPNRSTPPELAWEQVKLHWRVG